MTNNNWDQWAIEILEDNMEGYTIEERETYLQDVVQHGCISGCVSGVIYNRQIREIFEEHVLEILEVIQQFDYDTDQHLLGTVDATSIPETAVWFIVEQTASNMLQVMETQQGLR